MMLATMSQPSPAPCSGLRAAFLPSLHEDLVDVHILFKSAFDPRSSTSFLVSKCSNLIKK